MRFVPGGSLRELPVTKKKGFRLPPLIVCIIALHGYCCQRFKKTKIKKKGQQENNETGSFVS